MPSPTHTPADSLFTPEARAAIQQRLGHLTPESERRWGQMTAHQMVCHLSDAFRVSAGERSAQPIGGPLEHTLMRWIAIHTALPWPKGKIKAAPELDQAVGGTRPAEFRQDVAELVGLVERFAASGTEMEGRSHPYFGTLSAWEWGRWAYRHVDYHLRQFGM